MKNSAVNDIRKWFSVISLLLAVNCSLLVSCSWAESLQQDVLAEIPSPPKDSPGFPSRCNDFDVLSGFQSPPSGYGQVAFWWWTGDPLDKERLLWQIEELHRKGVSGMQVNYAHEDTPGWPTYPMEPALFSNAWWDIWKFVAHECAKRDMGIGLSGYTIDWPNGKSLISSTIYSDPEIQGREITIAARIPARAGILITKQLPAHSIGVHAYRIKNKKIECGGIDLLPFVKEGKLEWQPVDGEWQIWLFTAPRKAGTLNPMHSLAGKRVIEKFFQQFQNHAPNQSAAGLNYFFHDELQFGVGDNIWVDDFPEVFRNRKGYDVFDILPALFTDIGPITPKARLDFMDVKVQLSEERYFRPIFKWHWSRGKIYGCDQGGRGRNPLEFGDYFRSVRWYTAPGHDTPGGHADLIKGKVSSSIAHLYQRPRVWLEGYHSLGWSATPEMLMQATRENFIYGCTLLNLHGLYYTTHGGYWEWAPPCYHFRMPYWEHMDVFMKYFERLSYLLSQGIHCCDVAVMYPVAPLQAGIGGKEATSIAFETGQRLMENGIDFDFMDFQSLDRTQIHDGRLHVSGEKYSVLVLPSMQAVRWSTILKARQFYREGGTVISIGSLPMASDRIGSNDSLLDEVVREIFGASASEVKAGTKLSLQKNAAGGIAFAATPDTMSGVRRYTGGYKGSFVWSKEHVSDVYFKGVWKASSLIADNCHIKFLCDNSGSLTVNGRQLCESTDYQTGWMGDVSLQAGDVITVDAHDHDDGNHSAGMFIAVVCEGKTVMSSRDFRYSTKSPTNKWRTNTDLTGLSLPSTENIHEAHRGDSRDVFSAFSRIASLIPRDVRSDPPAKVLHRRIGFRDVYMVMGAARGSQCFFRSTGAVESWDPWTGQTHPVDVLSTTAEGTFVRLPLEDYEAQIIVFDSSKTSTSPEVIRPVMTSHTFQQIPLDGPWEFELKPTLDNRWGDFRLPVTDKIIGAEARIFRYVTEQQADPDWWKSDYDDSDWPRITCGFGQKFWKLGPLPDNIDSTDLERQLAAIKRVEPSTPVEIGAKAYHWTSYEISWRWGVEGDPGHQGYHGLKENITDDFICLGKPQAGLNEILYVNEPSGSRYYLWTTAAAPADVQAQIFAGGLIPAAIYINGLRYSDSTDMLTLHEGSNPLLLCYDKPGRSHFVLERTDCSQPTLRTPLSMQWYDRPGRLPFDIHAGEPTPAGWYRFIAPPGLKAMTATVHGEIQAWANEKPVTVERQQTLIGGAIQYRLRLAEGIAGTASIALRIEPERGYYGGSALPKPITLECGSGIMSTGDWSQVGILENYSGGAWYRKAIILTSDQIGTTVLLNLGHVVATAEVHVNGHLAGIRVAPPWKVDVTKFLKPGQNKIEILVYNTLANHYLTIPTRYRGSLRSGLIGPVTLDVTQAASLNLQRQD
ncbi:MAG: hypothetical protein JXA82_14640 [Sedimentisphaerales bacterium]|nr:hypothetical protein [Sedimentisphaerales bacterium]